MPLLLICFLSLSLRGQVGKMLGGRVKVAVTGGGPISADVQNFIRVAMHFNLVQGYGLTETCALVAKYSGLEDMRSRGTLPRRAVLLAHSGHRRCPQPSSHGLACVACLFKVLGGHDPAGGHELGRRGGLSRILPPDAPQQLLRQGGRRIVSD